MANFTNPFENSTDILGDIKKAQNELLQKKKTLDNVTVGVSPDCDFSTIQEAIDVVKEGCVITIKAGTYTECLHVNKSISLVGEKAGTVIISQPKDTVCTVSKEAFFANIIFKNSKENTTELESINDIPHCALVKCEANANFENCDLFNSCTNGLFIDNEIQIALKNCKVWNINSIGIYATNNSSLSLKDCEVSKTGDDCLVINNKAAIYIINSKLHNTRNGYGIKCTASSKITADSCEIWNTKRAGIMCKDEGSSMSLTNCKIHNIKDFGIIYVSPIKSSISNCEIYQTEEDGISCPKGILSMSECKIYDIKKDINNTIQNNSLKNNNVSKIGNGQTIAKIQKNKTIYDFCQSDLILAMLFVCPIFMVIYAGIIFWEYLDYAQYIFIFFWFLTLGTIDYTFLDDWECTRIIKKKSNNDSIMDWIVFFIFDIIRITIGGIVGLSLWPFLHISLPIEDNILWLIIPGMAYSGLFILLAKIDIIYYKINKNPKLLQIITLAIINVIIIIGIVNLKSQNNFQSISHNNEKLSYIVIGKNEEIKTLKKAIKLIDEGGTIELRPGTYIGININKNIKLLGIKEDIKTKTFSELPIIKGLCKIKANAEIEGVVFTKSIWEDNCLLVKSDSRIKNIAILNSGHDGIVFTAKNATLENSIISNCANYGIRCRGNASPSITNTQINEANDAGIVLEDNSNPLLMNCKISGSDGYGLVIKNTASGNFSNCIINNSGYSGIVIKSPVKSVFLNCDIFNNGGNGVKISNGPQLIMGVTSRFEKCKMHNNKNGILIYNKANPILQDCEIYSNKVYGIYIKNYVDSNFPSCFIHDNTMQNIFIDNN